MTATPAMRPTIQLLHDRPRACKALGYEAVGGRLFGYKTSPTAFSHFDDGGIRCHVIGTALLWLAERHAYPQLLEGRWDVVASDGSIGSTVLVEGRDAPLVAMLDAIEEWDETPAHSKPGLELYDEGGDR